MRLKEYVANLISELGSVEKLISDSTERIFYLIRNNNHEIKEISINKLQLNKFYLIKYNYNGNKIWCPILTLEYKVVHNKNVLYAINLDYLPYYIKTIIFDRIFYQQNDNIDDNIDKADVINENPLDISFEYIYKLLKNNGGYEYSLTGFDVLKIKNCFAVSTNIFPRFIFLKTGRKNLEEMRDIFKKMSETPEKKELKLIIEGYEKLLSKYKEDIKEYYKTLKDYEKNLKLIK